MSHHSDHIQTHTMASYATLNPFDALGDPYTPMPKRSRVHKPTAISSDVGPPGLVMVYYRAQFPKTEGTRLVSRHTPVDKLKSINQVQNLAQEFGGDVLYPLQDQQRPIPKFVSNPHVFCF